MKVPDISLANAAPAGEGETLGEPRGFLFTSFFKAEWPKLRNYLTRFVGGDEAEDIAQEAFTRVYAVGGDVRSPNGLLYLTARNLLIDRSRKRARAGQVLIESDFAEQVADQTASPEEQVELRERLDRAAAMLERMPRKCREVFLLQVIDGYTYAEIAGQLGISVVGVKKQLMRAFAICAAHAEAEERRQGRDAERGTRRRRP